MTTEEMMAKVDAAIEKAGHAHEPGTDVDLENLSPDQLMSIIEELEGAGLTVTVDVKLNIIFD